MKKNVFNILLALSVLVLSSLACEAVTGPPPREYTPEPEPSHIVNAHMSLDAEDKIPTSTYTIEADTFYCFFDLVKPADGSVVRGDWILLSAEGYQPRQLIDSAEINGDEGNYYFSLNRTEDSWAEGYYTIEIYYDGNLAATVDFEVK